MRFGKRHFCFLLTAVLALTVLFGTGLSAFAAYRVGDIIQYGTYPQSRVTDEETLAGLNETILGSDWKSYGYPVVTGNKIDNEWDLAPSDYMRYADVVYKGEKYRAVTFDEYRPSSVGLYGATSSQYNQGYYRRNVYWFRYEPLLWRVLDPSTGFVLCETVIDAQPFHNYAQKDGVDAHGSDAWWGDAERTHYANNYAKSDIRKWLNDTFYGTAFSSTEKNNINRSTLRSDCYATINGSTEYHDYDAPSTVDKIFLLSFEEVTETAYGFDPSTNSWTARCAFDPTDYAYCQGLYPDRQFDGQNSARWILRTAKSFQSGILHVDYTGFIEKGSNPYNGTTSAMANNGIRPAMRLKTIQDSTIGSKAVCRAAFIADGKIVKTLTYTLGTESIPEPAVPAKEGYEIVGWADYTLDGHITIPAVYSPVTYYATFTANGEVVGTVPYTMDTESIRELEPEVPALSGCTGVWQSYTLEIGGITVTAKYILNTYKVNWNVNGTVTQMLVQYGDPIQKPANPVKEGFVFQGWSPEIPAVMPAHDMTFTARFSPNFYTVTWNMGDAVIETQTPCGSTIQTPDVPFKEGYRFTGWTPELPETMPAKNLTFTAQYTPIAYSILWDTGDTIMETTTVYGSPIQAPDDPVREGCRFIGWTPEIPETMPAGGLIFTAQFTPNLYNITWYAGYTILHTQAAYASPIEHPNDPVMKSYRFTGWTPEIPETMPAGDLTFIAQYEPLVVTSLTVTQLPDKTSYIYRIDRELDLNGIQITAAYSDGSTGTVHPSDCTITGFRATSVGDQTITVEYEGHTAQFDVRVRYAWWQRLILPLIYLCGLIRCTKRIR